MIYRDAKKIIYLLFPTVLADVNRGVGKDTTAEGLCLFRMKDRGQILLQQIAKRILSRLIVTTRQNLPRGGDYTTCPQSAAGGGGEEGSRGVGG